MICKRIANIFRRRQEKLHFINNCARVIITSNVKQGRKQMRYLINLIFLVLCSCTIEGGDVVERDKNKNFVCTDTRDGEVFSFSSRTITNIRRGIGAPSSFEITDSDGTKRLLTSEMESYLKCVEK